MKKVLPVGQIWVWTPKAEEFAATHFQDSTNPRDKRIAGTPAYFGSKPCGRWVYKEWVEKGFVEPKEVPQEVWMNMAH